MKIKRQINQRTYQRFKRMVCAGSLVLGVNYLSEKSMQSVIDIASDSSNSEYDWSLPFVTAQDKSALTYELGSGPIIDKIT